MAAPTSPLERLRATHRRSLVTALGHDGPQSRADLARATGLSRTTVSGLVAELLASGQVVESEDRGRPHKGGSGRPPVLVALTTPLGHVAAVDVGHQHLGVAVADRSGAVLAQARERVDVDAAGPAILDRAAAMVRAAVEEAGLSVPALHDVAMCLPAPIDRRTSQITSAILAGWRDVVPGEELGRRLGRPVVADNDANLGALAELHHGAAQGVSDVVYVKVSSGVGAGIVLGGRLHRGATGIAGEIGHVQLREDGAVCRCGNRGCLETEVTLPRVLALLQPAYDEPLDAARLIELDAQDDAGVRRVLGDAGLAIGRALGDLCNSLNPELVVIGGPLGSSGALLAGIRSAVDRYAQPATAHAVRVAAAELGDRAEITGALTLAIARAAAEERA